MAVFSPHFAIFQHPTPQELAGWNSPFTHALGYLRTQRSGLWVQAADQYLSQFEQHYPGCYTRFALLATVSSKTVQNLPNRKDCQKD
jgi:hypothetical protein